MNTELMALVRKVIKKNKGKRHEQEHWIGLPESYDDWQPVETVAAYATQPVPAMPADPANPVCMTTACVAGWAAVLGSPPRTKIRRVGSSDAILDIPGQDGSPDRRTDLREAAIEALGIDPDQAEWLFNGNRTRKQVLGALKWLPDHPDATQRELLREFGG